MSKRTKESNERNDEGSSSSSLLSRLSTQDLKSIKVAIRRHNVPESTSPVTVQRHLEDPAELVLYRREDEGQHPIFDRRDIVVNVEKHLEERFILKSPVRHTEDGREKRSRSRSPSDRERSADSYRSRSSRTRRSKSPDRKGPVKKSAGYAPRLSPSRNVGKYGKSHAERRRSRSASPSYKRRDDYRNRGASRDKYYREKSPKPGTSKDRKEDVYKKDRYRLSPRKSDYVSPKRDDKNRSRSRTPKKPGYKYGEKEKYGRPRSPPPLPPKRYSASPHRRRSRSPRSRRHSPSPTAVRRSRSPRTKRTPTRDSGSSKPRKRSASPCDKDGYHGRSAYPKRRSRSPYPRNRSPHKSESSHRYRRSSRSPRKDSDYYRRRSRSPRRRNSRPEGEVENYEEAVPDNAGGYGCDPNFPYYGPPALWIPGPMLRPRMIFHDGPLPPPRGFPPRLRPGYYIPRPYMPIPAPFDPRFPIYPRSYRPRLNSSTSVTATVASTVTSTVTRATPTTSAASSVSETTNPIVEEPESDNVVSTVQDKV